MKSKVYNEPNGQSALGGLARQGSRLSPPGGGERQSEPAVVDYRGNCIIFASEALTPISVEGLCPIYGETPQVSKLDSENIRFGGVFSG